MLFINIIDSSIASDAGVAWMLPPRELDSFKRLLASTSGLTTPPSVTMALNRLGAHASARSSRYNALLISMPAFVTSNSPLQGRVLFVVVGRRARLELEYPARSR